MATPQTCLNSTPSGQRWQQSDSERMGDAQAPDSSHNGLNGPSKYPSITTHRGALPESWFPKWLLRWLQRRHPKPA